MAADSYLGSSIDGYVSSLFSLSLAPDDSMRFSCFEKFFAEQAKTSVPSFHYQSKLLKEETVNDESIAISVVSFQEASERGGLPRASILPTQTFDVFQDRKSIFP